jgi:hypothetical protein
MANTTASTMIIPARPAPLVQPANKLPGLPFLPLQEIASYLSLDNLNALYYTHRQLRATIDEGSLAFFGRFWHESPRSEWVNRARRVYGWYDKTAHPGRVDATTKLGDVGMDEFWKQIKRSAVSFVCHVTARRTDADLTLACSAFWVSTLAGDRNDRAVGSEPYSFHDAASRADWP